MSKIDGEECVLIIVDIQKKFEKVIPGWQNLVQNAVKAVRGCQILGIPVIVTEQYPEGLGETVPDISYLFTDFRPNTKTCFSCYESIALKNRLEKIGRKNIILAGIETHICIYNTAVDLLDAGYNVYLLLDAISSRTKLDTDTAIGELMRLGVHNLTCEMLFFQIMKNSKNEVFTEIQSLIK